MAFGRIAFGRITLKVVKLGRMTIGIVALGKNLAQTYAIRRMTIVGMTYSKQH
jgi:hypothetical protein